MILSKPLLIYDGDCGFCRRHVAKWKTLAGGAVDFAPYQEAGARFPAIAQEKFLSSVQLVLPDGSVTGGAEAVFRVLAHHPGKAWLLRTYRGFPLFAAVAEAVYGFVSRHRTLASKLDGWLVGYDAPAETTWHTARFLFLKCLAGIYLAAFASLGLQILGLSGSQGVLPAAEILSVVRAHRGLAGLWEWPSFLWLAPSDAGLLALAWGGAVLSLAALAGLWPRLTYFLLWTFYLSLVSVTGDFMRFQWDYLLLEAGFLAVFFAPGGFWAGLRNARTPPSAGIRWLIAWLLFRLMFMSGAVKLLSGDAVWWNLTALTVHYETQPLPTVFAWYAHHLPLFMQRVSCGVMFAIELGAPFLIFAPRRLRHAAGFAFVFLQTLILLTGNYCFFNLLALALCLVLYDDAFWRFVPPDPAPRRGAAAAVKKVLTGILISAVLVFSVLASGSRARAWEWPKPLLRAYGWIQPFGVVNIYGLFADMTTERNEIVIEGTWDGQTWEEIQFPFKPGALDRAPRWAAPHQPRLDWQMWFAALGTWKQNPWFVRFVRRVLQGSPEVMKLLVKNPNHAGPPSSVRALMYRYRFTDAAAKKATGRWWEREYRGMYFPPVGLEDFREKS